LIAQLGAQLQQQLDDDPFHSPGNHIFLDIVRNRGRKKNGRRYSPITLQWSYTVFQQSPALWEIVRDGLPLPSDHLLESHFAKIGTILSEALVDMDQVGLLVDLWNQSHSQTVNDRRVILTIDAVSFRPRVTIRRHGAVDGLEDIKQFEGPDLFEQFMLSPKEFAAFFEETLESR
jgi:hypothetical protein